jgi:hypothetical protein
MPASRRMICGRRTQATRVRRGKAVPLPAGSGLGAIVWAIIVYGFGMRAYGADGRFVILIFAGGGLAYLAAKITRKQSAT